MTKDLHSYVIKFPDSYYFWYYDEANNTPIRVYNLTDARLYDNYYSASNDIDRYHLRAHAVPVEGTLVLKECFNSESEKPQRVTVPISKDNKMDPYEKRLKGMEDTVISMVQYCIKQGYFTAEDVNRVIHPTCTKEEVKVIPSNNTKLFYVVMDSAVGYYNFTNGTTEYANPYNTSNIATQTAMLHKATLFESAEYANTVSERCGLTNTTIVAVLVLYRRKCTIEHLASGHMLSCTKFVLFADPSNDDSDPIYLGTTDPMTRILAPENIKLDTLHAALSIEDALLFGMEEYAKEVMRRMRAHGMYPFARWYIRPVLCVHREGERLE